MTRVLTWLRCKCTCIDADTVEFDAMPDVVRIGDYKKPNANPNFNGAYVRETSDVVLARNALASKYIEQGLTFKHAWYKAFQAHPRVYLDEADKPSPPSTDDCDPGKTFFEPRV